MGTLSMGKDRGPLSLAHGAETHGRMASVGNTQGTTWIQTVTANTSVTSPGGGPWAVIIMAHASITRSPAWRFATIASEKNTETGFLFVNMSGCARSSEADARGRGPSLSAKPITKILY